MKRAAQFKMYDAVPSAAGDRAVAPPTETDAEIEKFLPMLKDYLNGARHISTLLRVSVD